MAMEEAERMTSPVTQSDLDRWGVGKAEDRALRRAIQVWTTGVARATRERIRENAPVQRQNAERPVSRLRAQPLSRALD